MGPLTATRHKLTPTSSPEAKHQRTTEATDMLDAPEGKPPLPQIPSFPCTAASAGTASQGSDPSQKVTPKITNEDIMQTLTQMISTMALKEDVREAQENTVKQLRTEFRGELEPVKESLATVSKRQAVDSDRIGVLEKRVENVESGSPGSQSSSGPNPHDVSHRRVAFIGFPESSTVKARIAAMEEFMQTNFPDIRVGLADLFPDKKTGKPTRNGFVEVGSKVQARHVTGQSKAGSLVLKPFNAVSQAGAH